MPAILPRRHAPSKAAKLLVVGESEKFRHSGIGYEIHESRGEATVEEGMIPTTLHYDYTTP